MNFKDDYRKERGWRKTVMLFALVLMLAGVGIVIYHDGFPKRTFTGTRELLDVVSLGLVGAGFALVVIVVLSWIFERRR